MLVLEGGGMLEYMVENVSAQDGETATQQRMSQSMGIH